MYVLRVRLHPCSWLTRVPTVHVQPPPRLLQPLVPPRDLPFVSKAIDLNWLHHPGVFVQTGPLAKHNEISSFLFLACLQRGVA